MAKVIPELSDDDFLRFRYKVNDTEGKDACWNWCGSRNSDGYGQFSLIGSIFKSHRIAYKVSTGNEPGKMEVCHKCDNPACCNPAHLFLDTHSGNMKDCAKKGRLNIQKTPYFARAVLNGENVASIRSRYNSGESIQGLASEFSVHVETVRYLIKRKTWRHILPLIFLLSLINCFATDVQFQLLDPMFGVSQTSNRLVIVQAESGTSVNGPNVLLPFKVQQVTSRFGICTFSNLFGGLLSGFYHVTIPAPPQRYDFDIWVSSTNLGLVQASTLIGVFGAPTYPASDFAWSAQVSDARYLTGTNGQGSFVLAGQLINASNQLVIQFTASDNAFGLAGSNNVATLSNLLSIAIASAKTNSSATNILGFALNQVTNIVAVSTNDISTWVKATFETLLNAPNRTNDLNTALIARINLLGVNDTNQANLIGANATNYANLVTNGLNFATHPEVSGASNVVDTHVKNATNDLAISEALNYTKITDFIAASNFLQLTKQPGSINLTNWAKYATNEFVNQTQVTAISNTLAGGVGGGGWSLSGNTISGGNVFGTLNNASALVFKYNNGTFLFITNGTIVFGANNFIRDQGSDSVISGGILNRMEFGLGFNVANVIAGGSVNLITNALYSAISGGQNNTVEKGAQFSAIPGGSFNTVSANYGFAAGRQAKATNAGSFVMADSTALDFGGLTNDSLSLRFNNGIRLVTGGAGMTIDGVPVGGAASTNPTNDLNTALVARITTLSVADSNNVSTLSNILALNINSAKTNAWTTNLITTALNQVTNIAASYTSNFVYWGTAPDPSGTLVAPKGSIYTFFTNGLPKYALVNTNGSSGWY